MKEGEEATTNLPSGDVALVEMSTEHYVCIEAFTSCPPLGRLALTSGKTVVAIGRVVEILPQIKQFGSKAPQSKYFKSK
jgi:elongation factor 1-alpha